MPSDEHENRVSVLELLARLAGFTSQAPGPRNSRRPDVVRFHPGSGAVFIGEAKHSEAPGSSAARARLLPYLSGFRRILQSGRRGSIFAMCVHEADAIGWTAVILQLASAAGIDDVEVREWPIPPEAVVLWTCVGSTARSREGLRGPRLVGDCRELTPAA